MSNGSPRYALEKLSQAARLLAGGQGDVRARLRRAHMEFHPVHERDFPEHLQRQWKWIESQLTKHGPIQLEDGTVLEGSVNHTLRRIRNSTGERIAKAILEIKYDLEEWLRVQ